MSLTTIHGFTLMELMIVIAIVGILVAVAIPSYQTYARRAHYTEVVQATAPYKIGVEECYQFSGQLDHCTSGQQGIPPAIEEGMGNGLIETITVRENGEIAVTPQTKYGIDNTDTYILTPTIQGDRLIWESGGGGVTRGYAR